MDEKIFIFDGVDLDELLARIRALLRQGIEQRSPVLLAR